jgi:peroxiredoxin
MQLNHHVPNFDLPDLNGKTHSLSDYLGQVVIVNFWSAECPWAERADLQILSWLAEWGEQVVYLPVASNANEPSEMLSAVSRQRGLDLVLSDVDQELADSWSAETTPHIFVIDAEGILRYQGAVDDVTFRKRTPEHYYLKEAVDAILAGNLPGQAKTHPYGCTVVRLA